jgi:hypothetical protein
MSHSVSGKPRCVREFAEQRMVFTTKHPSRPLSRNGHQPAKDPCSGWAGPGPGAGAAAAAAVSFFGGVTTVFQ